MPMIEHRSDGDPCRRCAEPASKHRARKRPQHTAKGDPCEQCGEPADKHPASSAIKRRARYDRARGESRQAARVIIGIDGEGQDTPDGRHIYTYLCAADERGRVVSEAYNAAGLSHNECADMLARVPRNALKVAFMFSYDVTKIIEDLPEIERYRLMRPELLKERRCKDCGTKWRSIAGRYCPNCQSDDSREHFGYLRYKGRGYKWFAGSLTIASDYDRQRGAWKRSTQIWDVFRFFQCSFVDAITAWKIGTPEQRERIAAMKAKRGSFDVESAESVKAYCREECTLLARMMRQVIEAHKRAGIELKRYEGAGSSASALLKKHGVSKYRGPRAEKLNPRLMAAVTSAFFGGRFENSFIGSVNGAVYGYDIASAYPYCLAELPCLACGTWRHVKRDIVRQCERADLALIRYHVKGLSPAERERLAWAPLPFRDSDGSIAYPLNSWGWGYAREVLAAARHWPGLVTVSEAWLYRSRCSHAPFGFLPAAYRERVSWGKDGPGKVLKLAKNATYGKTAQTVGDDPPFRSLIWAGACTSHTRAMILNAITCASDRWNVVAIATDGIYSREPLTLPLPRDTGTSDLPKPLGFWEANEPVNGANFIKPGLYFKAEAELSDVRARGIGRREVYEHRQKLIRALAAWDKQDYNAGMTVASRRFFGAKHSLTCQSSCAACEKKWPGMRPCPECGELGRARIGQITDARGKPVYGLWGERSINIRFDPRPKREAVRNDGRMTIRDMGGRESSPYTKGVTSPEGEAARVLREFMLMQPDVD